MRLSVVIADDEPDVRTALADLLATVDDVDVVGVAGTTDEVVRVAERLRPDVVLMDVKMPGGGGAAATSTLRGQAPATRVVAVTAYQDRATIMEMLGAGAVGYVTKGSPADDIIAAVHRAAQGLAMLSPGASTELVREVSDRARAERQESERRRRLRARLQAALEGDLRMVYQPVVHLGSGRLAGVEALARFDGPDARTPDVWFAEAAEIGMGVQLEHAALRLATADAGRLPPDVFLSVNLSPTTVVQPGFSDAVRPEVTDRLVLELTEHAVVDDYDRLAAALAPLRQAGVRLAVDDAGAGFASLRHILLLEADLIKIDAGIIRDLDRNRPRRALAAALTSFAAETGALIIAEGIERAAELQTLRRLGAGYGQGYLLGRPMALDRIVELAGGGAGSALLATTRPAP